MKKKLLFLCTGNSCRSQMAEGWLRYLKDDYFEVFSAGIEVHGLNPTAVEVMAEAGVDISDHYSKNISELESHEYDYIITVCDHAHESCPIIPVNTILVHVGFEDPPALARAIKSRGGSEKEQLDCYRRVRDQIKAYILTLPDSLPGKHAFQSNN